MAQICFTIPDAVLGRVINAIAGYYGYAEKLSHPLFGNQEPNPETKAQFAKRMLRRHLKGLVRAWESELAAKAAGDTAGEAVDTEINIT